MMVVAAVLVLIAFIPLRMKKPRFKKSEMHGDLSIKL